MTPEPYRHRYAAVQAWLRSHALDGLLLVPGANMQYLSGYRGSTKLVPHDLTRATETMIPTRDFTLLALGREGEPFFFAFRKAEIEAIRRVSPIAVAPNDGSSGDLVDALKGVLQRSGMLGGTVGVDEQTWWGVTNFLTEHGLVNQCRNASAILYQLRRVKDPAEISVLQKAGRVAQEGFAAGFKAARPGMRESDLARIVGEGIEAAGGEVHKIVIVSGGRRIPEVTTDRRLLRGDVILIDINAMYAGYNVDITRMGACEAASPRIEEVHGLLLEAQEAARKAARPGVNTGDIDAAGRDVLERAGLGKAFTHGIGHGVGLSDHEGPWLNSQNPTQAYPGMVHTLEPAVYLDEFNARLEDVFVVDGEGCSWVPTWPRELTIAPVG